MGLFYKDEFLSFRHPESSHSSLLTKADDLLGEYGNFSEYFLLFFW